MASKRTLTLGQAFGAIAAIQDRGKPSTTRSGHPDSLGNHPRRQAIRPRGAGHSGGQRPAGAESAISHASPALGHHPRLPQVSPLSHPRCRPQPARAQFRASHEASTPRLSADLSAALHSLAQAGQVSPLSQAPCQAEACPRPAAHQPCSPATPLPKRLLSNQSSYSFGYCSERNLSVMQAIHAKGFDI